MMGSLSIDNQKRESSKYHKNVQEKVIKIVFMEMVLEEQKHVTKFDYENIISIPWNDSWIQHFYHDWF